MATAAPARLSRDAAAKAAPDQQLFVPADQEETCYELTTYPGAQMTELTEKATAGPRLQRGGGRRGKAKPYFTPRQRRTLEKTLGKLHLEKSFYSITLTYPPNFDAYPEHGYPTAPSTIRKDLNSFFGRLQYRFDIGAIWRLEFQAKRGAPHFHMVLYGLGELLHDEVKSTITLLWLETLGMAKGDAHAVDVQRPGTRADRKRALTYLAKRDAAQLTSPHIDYRGRFWGKKGKKHLPFVDPVTTELTPSEGNRLRRSMRLYRDKTSNRKIGAQPHNPSIRLRRGEASQWQRLVDMTIGEREYVSKATGEIRPYRELVGAGTRDAPGDAESIDKPEGTDDICLNGNLPHGMSTQKTRLAPLFVQPRCPTNPGSLKPPAPGRKALLMKAAQEGAPAPTWPASSSAPRRRQIDRCLLFVWPALSVWHANPLIPP